MVRQCFPALSPTTQQRLRRVWDEARERCLDHDSPADALTTLFGLSSPAEQDAGDAKRLLAARTILSTLRAASLDDWANGNAPDFTDQLWLPIQLGFGRGKLGTLFVDEAQDLTPLRQAYLQHVLGLATPQPGRLILVGDPDQAVYQYAWADPQGMSRLAQEIGAREMPLSVSWRCPSSHVALAHHASRFIRAAPQAREGRTEHVEAATLGRVLRRGQTVLARTNAALLRLALELLERHVSVDLRGWDLDQHLGRVARDAFGEPYQASEIELRLAPHLRKRAAPFEKALLEGDDQARRQLRELQDVFDCVALLAARATSGGYGTLESLLALIQTLCRAGGDVILSTIHRAKGLEWDDVTLLYPESLPLRSGDPEEERCVLFVALTRSRETLRFAYGRAAWAEGWRVQPWTADGAFRWLGEQPEADRGILTPIPEALPLQAHATPFAPVIPAPRPAAGPAPQPEFTEEDRQRLAQAQARLNQHRQQARETHAPTQLQDVRHLSPFHGLDAMPTGVLSEVLRELAKSQRPMLKVWAEESLTLLGTVTTPTVLVNAAFVRELGHYLRTVQVAELRPVEAGHLPVFEALTVRIFLTRAGKVKRRGKKTLSVQVGQQLMKFDPLTGEVIGQPFGLWRTFAKVS